MPAIHASARCDDARPVDSVVLLPAAPEHRIRSVTPADAPDILAAAANLVARTVDDPVDGQNVTLIDPTLAEKSTLRPRLTAAFVGDDIAACLVTKRDPSGCLSWAGTLCVDRRFRQQGLAKQIVAAAVADREREDGGARLPCFALIRVQPGGINWPSLGAFEANNFNVVGVLSMPVVLLGDRGRHFALTASPTDGTVQLLLAARFHLAAASMLARL